MKTLREFLKKSARFCRVLGAAALLLLPATVTRAHTTGESFVTLDRNRIHLELALRDLDDALLLDQDGNGELTRAELGRRQGDIEALLKRQVSVSSTGPCALRPEGFALANRSEGAYAAITFALGCPGGAALTIDDQLFFDQDRSHSAFVRFEDGARQETALLRAGQTRARFVLHPAVAPGAAATLARFVREGVLHIWQGLDHVLFVVVLLLPAVLRRQGARWVPAQSLREVLLEVLRVVTAFTLAHSLTLALASLGLVHASARIIEPAIAASVVLAAANNLMPLYGRDRWLVACALGLLHGFGFSSVLAEVGLPQGQFLLALFGFNLGVELGQLALVVVLVPLSFLLRARQAYRRICLRGGSALAAVVAAVWFCERTFGVSLFG